ncbi:MAG: hypothetical protein IT198_05400 [Acidimicrobiia bacterium]|nr:hypothetical protein [Acidimicrobiia bacterium]
MLRIAVCAKQVLDPEAPAELLRVGEGLTVTASGTPEVLSPYDANALKAAADLRGEGETPNADVTLLTVGPRPAKPLLLKALASGADRVLALRTADEVGRLVDGLTTARRLAALVGEMGDCDLVLTGRQAADTNAGVVGPLLAGILGIDLVTVAVGIRAAGLGTVEVDRLTEGGIETIECGLPAVVTVSSEIGDPGPVDFPALAAAKRKPIRILEAAELDLRDSEADLGPVLVDLVKPKLERTCEIVGGEDARAAGRALVARIAELSG